METNRRFLFGRTGLLLLLAGLVLVALLVWIGINYEAISVWRMYSASEQKRRKSFQDASKPS